jgi:hypothetical protein
VFVVVVVVVVVIVVVAAAAAAVVYFVIDSGNFWIHPHMYVYANMMYICTYV